MMCLTARIAQLVEQGIENPCVAGSIPAPGTTTSPKPLNYCFFDMVRSPSLQTAITSLQKIGRAIIRDFNEIEYLQASPKGIYDFIQASLKRIEEELKIDLLKGRAHFGFFTNLTRDMSLKEDIPDNCWVVTTLDGIDNFKHSIPMFSIVVSRLKKGQPIESIIFNPISDDLHWAEEGQGAFSNRQKLQISGRKLGVDNLIGIGPKDPSTLIPSTTDYRNLGCLSLTIVHVAAGKFDAMMTTNMPLHLEMVAHLFMNESKGTLKITANNVFIVGSPKIVDELCVLQKTSI
jgi:myo-inositol-1(or 4)-monophosphatase